MNALLSERDVKIEEMEKKIEELNGIIEERDRNWRGLNVGRKSRR